MSEIKINHRAQLSQLWWLRGKLTLRQFSREQGRIVVAALVIFLFLPLVCGAAFGTAVGYRRLEDQWPTALLGGVLTLLWLIWLAFPILFASINEGADVTRLLIYPIRQRTLITAVLLGTLFDYPTYLMLPLFLAIVYGFGLTLSPVALVVLVALVLSYGHLVMIGQLAGTAVGGIMQSRRVRDVAIILASLLGGMCYFINIGMQRFIQELATQFSAEEIEAARSIDPLAILQWLPPGATARAVERAQAADWLATAVWLLYSLAWLLLITWAWYKLLIRLTTGEGYLVTAVPRREARAQAVRQERRESTLLDWLPQDVAQLAIKEFKSVWRVPQRRVGIIQGVLMPVFFMGAFFFSTDSSQIGLGRMPAWLGLTLPIYALFLFWANTQNMLAWEGKGFPTLLLTPVKREHIFWAKGLALYVVTAIPLLFFGAIFVYFRQNWVSVAGVLTALCMGIAALAVTSVSSVLFPIPIALEARRNRSMFQSGGNMKTGCAYMTLVPIAVGVISFPAALPLAIAYWQDWPWLGFVGLVVSLAYVTAVYWGGTRLAAGLLLEREPEMVERLTLPDED